MQIYETQELLATAQTAVSISVPITSAAEQLHTAVEL